MPYRQMNESARAQWRVISLYNNSTFVTCLRRDRVKDAAQTFRNVYLKLESEN